MITVVSLLSAFQIDFKHAAVIRGVVLLCLSVLFLLTYMKAYGDVQAAWLSRYEPNDLGPAATGGRSEKYHTAVPGEHLEIQLLRALGRLKRRYGQLGQLGDRTVFRCQYRVTKEGS